MTTPATSVAVELPAHDYEVGPFRTWSVRLDGGHRASVVTDAAGGITVHVHQADVPTPDQAEALGRALLAAAADARARTEGET